MAMTTSELSRRQMLEALVSSVLPGGKGAARGHYTGPRLPAPAKHVIVLFLQGGPSQIDLFDPKPVLKKHEGQRPSAVDVRTERATGGLLPSPFTFKRHGHSGLELSSLLPQLSTVADDLCVLRSMYTFNPTHTPGINLFNCGTILATRPSLGSWVEYGLGSENPDLPGFVVLGDGMARNAAARSGFLPTQHQGISFDSAARVPDAVIPNLRNGRLDPRAQRRAVDEIQALNTAFNRSIGADPFLDGRIDAMEQAFRMQAEAYDIVDLSREPEHVRAEYGDTPYARSCLMACRLVEKGVRFVHVGYNGWDHHIDINKKLAEQCPAMDQATAALIRDLKRRGLLDETLVVWGGEFGRTPVSESGSGRDHNPYGFTTVLAGGGIKGGLAYGNTDEFGFKAIENRVSVHDLHATMLNRLGMDHTKLTYRYAGRDFRLTDVHGEVVKAILA